MNDFSVKAIDHDTLKDLDSDQIIAFSYAENEAKRFSGMIDIASINNNTFTFYFGNYLDGDLSIKDYAKSLLPLMRSIRLEAHLKSRVKDYSEDRYSSFDGLNFSLGAFSRSWSHYLIGEGRHLFISRKQDIYIEELAAAISENIAQSNIVPTIKTQIKHINSYWPKAIADIFEIKNGEYAKPNHAELRHLNAKSAQFIYSSTAETKIVVETGRGLQAYECNSDQLSTDTQQLLYAAAAENQSELVGLAKIELDYFFHSDFFHFINRDWIHISLGEGSFLLIRHAYFDQAMRLCSYYRRQDLYESIVDGKPLHDNSIHNLMDYYWRIAALRLAPNSKPYTKPFRNHLDLCPLTQHAYNLAQLESTMDKTVNLRKITNLTNLVNTYFEDIPNEIQDTADYLRRDKILAATIISQLSSHSCEDIRKIYGTSVSKIANTIRKFKQEKPETLSLSESMILTALILLNLKHDFSNLDIADFYRKNILKSYLEQISFIISDREKLPYANEGKNTNRNALWFSQLKILQMRLDYLLDN